MVSATIILFPHAGFYHVKNRKHGAWLDRILVMKKKGLVKNGIFLNVEFEYIHRSTADNHFNKFTTLCILHFTCVQSLLTYAIRTFSCGVDHLI